ncbi:hypothetical protein [Vibrio phage RYC]|nr:hypothetical protein [Vibrio phage RYC]
MGLIVLGGLIFAVICVLIFAFLELFVVEGIKFGGVAAGSLILLLLVTEGISWEDSDKYEDIQTKTFVSARTGEELQGHFVLGTGSLGGVHNYLIRTEEEDGFYRDVKLTGTVYLKELDRLTDKGEYKVVKTCHTRTFTLSYFFELMRDVNTYCAEERKELYVPKGTLLVDMGRF